MEQRLLSTMLVARRFVLVLLSRMGDCRLVSAWKGVHGRALQARKSLTFVLGLCDMARIAIVPYPLEACLPIL